MFIFHCMPRDSYDIKLCLRDVDVLLLVSVDIDERKELLLSLICVNHSQQKINLTLGKSIMKDISINEVIK